MKGIFMKYPALIMIFASVVSFCRDGSKVIEKRLNGYINWSRGVAVATGIGAPPSYTAPGEAYKQELAKLAAVSVAGRNLLAMVNGVRIESTTVVKNNSDESYSVEEDVILRKIEGIVRGAKIIDEEYYSNGYVKVTLSMSMYGGFSKIIFPDESKFLDSSKRNGSDRESSYPGDEYRYRENDYYTEIPSGRDSIPDKPGYEYEENVPEYNYPDETGTKKSERDVISPSSGVYTGLIVDARGLGATPSLSAKILDEDDIEVYGSASVSYDFALKQGMIAYAKNLDFARKNERVGENPLIIKAIGTSGNRNSDLIISIRDAAMVRKASRHLSFLSEGRVLVVVD